MNMMIIIFTIIDDDKSQNFCNSARGGVDTHNRETEMWWHWCNCWVKLLSHTQQTQYWPSMEEWGNDSDGLVKRSNTNHSRYCIFYNLWISNDRMQSFVWCILCCIVLTALYSFYLVQRKFDRSLPLPLNNLPLLSACMLSWLNAKKHLLKFLNCLICKCLAENEKLNIVMAVFLYLDLQICFSILLSPFLSKTTCQRHQWVCLFLIQQAHIFFTLFMTQPTLLDFF